MLTRHVLLGVSILPRLALTQENAGDTQRKPLTLRGAGGATISAEAIRL